MRINRNFTPFSLEIESKVELEFLQEILWETIKKRDYFILGRYSNDPTAEKAKYLLSLLEHV